MRLRMLISAIIVACAISACGGGTTPPPTLRGAIVPTRPTSTSIPTETATATPTATLTETVTSTVSATPTVTASATQTPEPTATATFTITPSPEITEQAITPTTESASTTGTSVALNSETRGVITADTGEVFYTFEASAGDTVTITLRADQGATLDPLLILTDASGNEIATSDDISSSDVNSEISAFVIPADGVYTIIATRFQRELGSTTGNFTLTVASGASVRVPTEAPATPQASTGDNQISYGQSLSGTITNDKFEDRYQFTGKTNEEVTISVQGENNSTLDTYVLLLDPQGVLIAENDDFDNVANFSRIENFTLPSDGDYTIVVTRFQQELGSTTGNYTLTLEATGFSAQSLPPIIEREAIDLPLAEGVEGEMARGQLSALYRFEGRAGEHVMLTARTRVRNLEVVLLLLDGQGRELARSRIGERLGLFSTIRNYSLPQDSVYYVMVVRAPSNNNFGRYVLTRENVPSNTPLDGVIAKQIAFDVGRVAELTPQDPDDLFTFEARAGDTIEISTELLRGNAETVLAVNRSFSTELTISLEPTITLQVTEDGYYSVYIRARTGGGQVQLTIRR